MSTSIRLGHVQNSTVKSLLHVTNYLNFSVIEVLVLWLYTDTMYVFLPHTATASYVPTLFHPHTAPPDSSVECLRVTQLISVLRNLSFSQTQAKELINNYTVLRYIL